MTDMPANSAIMGFPTSPDGSVVSGYYSTAIGCNLHVSENRAVGFGLDKTMALFHADGTWTLDWSEVARVAALIPASQPERCLPGVVIALAQALLVMRDTGRLREKIAP